MHEKLAKLHAVGQSIWCDNISRGMIDGGQLRRMIDDGITGVTSNPTIFMKAITGGNDYDALFDRLVDEGLDTMGVYEGLVLPDIADTADQLRETYDRTGGADGFVSLEVNPKLAHDTEGTIAEARRLYARLDRPNVMIKVPATEAGIPAIETLLAEGINVNVTLIFSLKMYDHVIRAYFAGLRRFADQGGDLSNVAGVASFFVSRVDTLVDERLNELASDGANVDGLLGRAAIANARLAYGMFREAFDDKGPFSDLARRGARPQRPLWASTSTKNPSYPDTLYCDTLVAPMTVNTLPPATIEAVCDHGSTTAAIPEQLDEERNVMARIDAVGISMNDVTDRLSVDGVGAFAASFEELLADLQKKKAAGKAAD